MPGARHVGELIRPFGGRGQIRLALLSATPQRSGDVDYRYRPSAAPAQR